jgi:hypothetical protein
MIKRYNIDHVTNPREAKVQTTEHPEGYWVRYEDVKHLMPMELVRHTIPPASKSSGPAPNVDVFIRNNEIIAKVTFPSTPMLIGSNYYESVSVDSEIPLIPGTAVSPNINCLHLREVDGYPKLAVSVGSPECDFIALFECIVPDVETFKEYGLYPGTRLRRNHR